MSRKSILMMSAFAAATAVAITAAPGLNLKVSGTKLEGKMMRSGIETIRTSETGLISSSPMKAQMLKAQKPSKPEDVPEERLVFEDFSKEIWQTGSFGAPDFSVDLERPDWDREIHGAWLVWIPEITNDGAWGGHYVYPAGGMACMNSERFDMGNQNTWITSNICTKNVDSTPYDGIVHIRFKARTMEGAQQDGVFLIEAAETYGMGPTWDVLGSAQVPVTDQWQTFEWEVVEGKQSVMFNFNNMTYTDVYIDDIEIYSWKQPASTPVSLHHTQYEGDSFVANWKPSEGAEKYILNVYQGGDLVMNPIETTETSYKVTGIDPTADYQYGICAVKGDYVSYESRRISVVDIAKPKFTNAEIGTEFITANWSPVESAQEVLYNHITYCERTVEEDGDFYFVDENFNNLDYREELKNAETPVTVQYTIDDPGSKSVGADYLKLDNTTGFRATNYSIYNQTDGKGRHLTVDAFFQCYNNEIAALISPEYDLSANNGEVTVTVDLAAEMLPWQYEDGTTGYEYPHALITMFNWDEEAQEFIQVTDSKNLFFIKQTRLNFRTYTVKFTCGSKRSKIGICGVYAPGNLYIDNLKISQNLKKGDKFIDIYDFTSYIEGTSVNVAHTNKSNELPLYHRASSVRILERNPYGGGFSYIESPFSDIQFIEGSESYTTGVDQVVMAGKAEVSLKDGVLAIASPEGAKVVVTDLQGRVIFTGNESVSLTVEKGIYLVKVGNDVAKVIY